MFLKQLNSHISQTAMASYKKNFSDIHLAVNIAENELDQNTCR